MVKDYSLCSEFFSCDLIVYRNFECWNVSALLANDAKEKYAASSMGGQACEICAGTDVLDLLLSLHLDVYARIGSRGGDWFLY